METLGLEGLCSRYLDLGKSPDLLSLCFLIYKMEKIVALNAYGFDKD